VDLTADLIPAPWLWLANLLCGVVLLHVLRRAPWGWLREPMDLNIWLATCLGLLLAWSLRAGIDPGLHLHFLGAMLLTLMFGWYFAVLGLGLVTAGITVLGHADWLAFGANMLVLGIIPVSFCYLVFLLVEWKLPRNFFIYIFVTAFWGSALSMVVTALVSAAFLNLAGDLPWRELTQGYLPYALLLGFPEGFTTGLLMSIFVVYKPQWVYTFRDDKYLKGK
jgi:uncharacterized membrane protein